MEYIWRGDIHRVEIYMERELINREDILQSRDIFISKNINKKRV